MANRAPTIIDIKAAFLKQQIHTLSEPLRPSANFQISLLSDNKTKLRPSSIESVLRQLNQRLQRHNRLVYGRRAQRHVAEQIDRLSWNDVSDSRQRVDSSVGDGLMWSEESGCDYCATETIEKLPVEWIEIPGERVSESLKRRYHELRSQLIDLNAYRHVAKERIENLKTLRDALRMLTAGGNIQENLVVRRGALEEELERMFGLMLRVERGIDGSRCLKRQNIEDANEKPNLDEGEEQKLLKLIT